jgi:uncharacterized protein (TIGR02246 family)
MRKLGSIGCAVLLLTSLSLAQMGGADEEAIRKLETEWSAAAQNKDLEKAVSYYADDAAVMPSNAPIATGKAQIRDVWSQMVAPGTSTKFETKKVQVAKSKDLAYTMGTYEMTTNDPQGSPKTEIGKYVTVWKKQADKQWKVVADIFNPDK